MTIRDTARSLQIHATSDPWRNLFNERLSFPIVWFPTIIHVRRFAIGAGIVSTLVGIAMLPKVEGLAWLTMALAIPAVLIAYCWRRPTFAHVSMESEDVEPGMVIVGYTAPTSNETFDGRAGVVIEIFHHHGRSLSNTRIALTNGMDLRLPRQSRVKVAIRHDLFARLRPPLTTPFNPTPVVTAPTLAILASLWDLMFEGYSMATADVLAERAELNYREAETALSDAFRLKLVFREHKGFGVAKETFYGLSTTGETTLAAGLRGYGVEIYSNAEERRMTYINNYGNYFDRSPGASAVQGSGTAGSNNTLSTARIDKAHPDFDHLLSTAEEIRGELSEFEVTDLEFELEEVRTQLMQPSPDPSRVQRSVRNIMRVSGTVLQGALGSGVWAAWAAWAGLG